MGPALRPTPLSPACGPRRTLNAWRLRVAAPKGRLAMSPGARAGAGSVGGRMKSEDSSKPLGGSATRLSARFVNWFGNAGHRLSIRTGRQIRPADFAPSRSQRAGSCEHPERRPWLSSLHRAASRHRVECGSKISSSFRVLPRRSEEPITALDIWKMRPGPESGKRANPWLSTFNPFAGGQGWITCVSKPKSGTYPRSRLANNRKRRAFSLMNPSASCWS
jgi:hypothetical protein